jgi:dTDP-4-dehydrorhamnose 3,5-epimerase
LYCFTSEWVPGMAGVAVHPLDPALAIEWPLAVDIGDPTQLSPKDAAQPLFADLT